MLAGPVRGPAAAAIGRSHRPHRSVQVRAQRQAARGRRGRHGRHDAGRGRQMQTNLLYMFRGVIPPKGGIGHHYHTRVEEMFVIFDNEAEFTIDGRTSRLAGPVGAPVRYDHSHAIYNSSDRPTQWMNIGVSAVKGLGTGPEHRRRSRRRAARSEAGVPDHAARPQAAPSGGEHARRQGRRAIQARPGPRRFLQQLGLGRSPGAAAGRDARTAPARAHGGDLLRHGGDRVC